MNASHCWTRGYKPPTTWKPPRGEYSTESIEDLRKAIYERARRRAEKMRCEAEERWTSKQ